MPSPEKGQAADDDGPDASFARGGLFVVVRSSRTAGERSGALRAGVHRVHPPSTGAFGSVSRVKRYVLPSLLPRCYELGCERQDTQCWQPTVLSVFNGLGDYDPVSAVFPRSRSGPAWHTSDSYLSRHHIVLPLPQNVAGLSALRQQSRDRVITLTDEVLSEFIMGRSRPYSAVIYYSAQQVGANARQASAASSTPFCGAVEALLRKTPGFGMSADLFTLLRCHFAKVRKMTHAMQRARSV